MRRYVAVPLWPVRWHGDRVSADVLCVLWCGEQRPCGKQMQRVKHCDNMNLIRVVQLPQSCIWYKIILIPLLHGNANIRVSIKSSLTCRHGHGGATQHTHRHAVRPGSRHRRWVDGRRQAVGLHHRGVMDYMWLRKHRLGIIRAL